MAKSYGFTMLKIAIAIVIPVGALMWISSANAGPNAGSLPPPKDEPWWTKFIGKKPSKPPEPKPEPEVPANIADAFDVVKPPDGATFAGWFTHIGVVKGIPMVWWIRIDEFVADAKIGVGDVGALSPIPSGVGITDEVTYQGQFRFTVMAADGTTPLAIQNVITDATADKLIGYTDAESLTNEARELAIAKAADAAAVWLDMAYRIKA